MQKELHALWTVSGRSLEYAEQRGVVLCMENHYKGRPVAIP